MTPLAFTATVLGLSVLAGGLGSLLGLGGGVIIVPALTLLLGVDIRLAMAASAISVVATSCAASGEQVRGGLANIRLATFLELGAAAGALTGALVSGVISSRWLYLIFALVIALSGVAMFRRPKKTPQDPPAAGDPPSELGLEGVSVDDQGREFSYPVRRPKLGLALIYLAGLFGGLLGVGAGVLKVPALDLAMRVPWRASTATSSLMIGVTAAASAGVFLVQGRIAPILVAPVALGVVIGANLGSKLIRRVPLTAARMLFFGVVLWTSVQMIRKGLA